MSTLFVSGMRFGDSLYGLPIASWYSKKYHTKVSWAVEVNVPYASALVAVLKAQPCIEAVHTFEYKKFYVRAWNHHAANGAVIETCFRPYHRVGAQINDRSFGGKYDLVYDFGHSYRAFSSRSDNFGFFSEHLAEEHGFDVDYDFKLAYGEPDLKYKNHAVKLDKFYKPMLSSYDAVGLDESEDVLKNLQLCAGARDVVTVRTGGAALLALARIPFKLVFTSHDYDYEWYMKAYHAINGGIGIIELNS